MPGKKTRQKILEEFWGKPQMHELDVCDKGDHIKVTSCYPEVVGWWIGTLRAVYPQDHLSGEGDVIKMHPRSGVTLKLNKLDGTLRIKGKKHMDWFQESFDNILAVGAQELAAVNEMARQCDTYLRLRDSLTTRDLLTHLPASGAFKHGPSYIYRLWRGLLDTWIGMGCDVYVVTPLLDAIRMMDILLMLVKHKLSGSRLHLMCLNRCDGDNKYPKILKDAKDLLRGLKGANKKRLIAEERIKMAEQRLDVRFGRFHCKLIAMCHHEGGAQVMVTSASFHKWHFELENGDTVAHFKLSSSDLVNNYLAPLGLAHQVILDNMSSIEETSSVRTSRSSMRYSEPSSPDSPGSPFGNNRSGPSSPHSRSVPSVINHSVSINGTGSRSQSRPTSSTRNSRSSMQLTPVAPPKVDAERERRPSASSSQSSQPSRSSVQLSPVPPPKVPDDDDYETNTLTSQTSKKSVQEVNSPSPAKDLRPVNDLVAGSPQPVAPGYSPALEVTRTSPMTARVVPTYSMAAGTPTLEIRTYTPPQQAPQQAQMSPTHHRQTPPPLQQEFRLSPSPIRVEVEQNSLARSSVSRSLSPGSQGQMSSPGSNVSSHGSNNMSPGGSYVVVSPNTWSQMSPSSSSRMSPLMSPLSAQMSPTGSSSNGSQLSPAAQLEQEYRDMETLSKSLTQISYELEQNIAVTESRKASSMVHSSNNGDVQCHNGNGN